MATVNISFAGKVRGPAALRKLGDLIGMANVANLVGERLAAWMVHNFEDEGTEKKWKPLAQSTIALRKHGGTKILQDSGRLRGFISEPTGRWVVGNIVHVGWRGPLALIAGYHHNGTGPYEIRAKQAKMLAAALPAGGFMIFGKVVHHPGLPARPLLPTVKTAETVVAGFLNAAVQKVINDASA